MCVACVLAGFAGFLIARYYVLYQTPRDVMTWIEGRLAESGGDVNVCLHRRDPAPKVGRIARGNPDIVPTSMVYDVSKGAVRLTGEKGPRYWSLSVFQHNTDNIFVVNDRELETNNFDIVITRAGRDSDSFPDSTIVESPSDTGVMLVRRFLANQGELDAVLANQDKMKCTFVPYGS